MKQYINRFGALLSSLVIATVALIPATAVFAAGTNLIANPGFETVSGTTPASWSKDNWGTNTPTFTYETTGHTGSRSATVKVSGYSDGDAKWYANPVNVTPNTVYTFSNWYKSTAVSGLDAVVTTTTGSTDYIHAADPAASAAWKQQVYTFTAPANAKQVTFYHYLDRNGTLTVDDYSLTSNSDTTPTPTAPTVSITAPATNATVSGTQTVSANASDAASISSVQFKLDGNNLGAADTTAPYSAAWDTKTTTNGTHSLTAVATNASNLTTTSTAVNVTVQNTATPTAPTVSITAPTANATVSATQTVTANASDAASVLSVQFKLDGANLGAADTTAPYSSSWDTKTAANGTHALTAVATNASNLTTTSSAVNVTVQNTATPTAPTVNITAPAANASVAATQTVTANASDTASISNVQFKLDGNNLGAADTTAPYSVSWDTKTIANGTHTLTAVATNASNLTTTSSPVSVVVSNPTAPMVSIAAPAANATVSASQTVTANASDTQSVSNVQFKLDGNNLGAADTTAPYSVVWDTKTAPNGTHSLTAVATNAANLSTTSVAVAVTVSNTVVTPPPSTTNLITNPSVETATNNLPNGWTSDGWGTNTHAFSYEATGQDGTHSVKTTVSAYTNGDAKWYFNPVKVTAGNTYAYSEWYKSNIASEVDAMVTLKDGSVQYVYLGAPDAAANWTKLNYQYVAPVNADTITFFHVVAKVGYVQSDNFSFAQYTPAQFNRALVSLTFDDGWRTEYTNGLPILKKYGFTSTQYVNSTPVSGGYPDYITYAMIKDYYAHGDELAWHTQDHVDLTTLTTINIDKQLTIPNAFLTASAVPASAFKNFATPYGAYNTQSVNEIKKYYGSHRSTDVGYNSKDNFNRYNILVQNILDTTTPADVQGWVNQAIATKTWLVLTYHEVSTTPESPEYAVTPANLDAELNIIKQSGLTVQTVQQALDEITPQL